MSTVYAVYLVTCLVGLGQPSCSATGAPMDADSCRRSAEVLNNNAAGVRGFGRYRFFCASPRAYPWDVVR